MNATLAVASGPVTHIAPQVVFHLGPLAITNSIFYGWISIVLMTVLFIWVARRMTVKPKSGLIQYIEVAAEFMIGIIESAFDDPEAGRKYALYFLTLFFFLLANNLMGLLPGVGDSLLFHNAPLLRPLTADFNATLAAAVITMGLVYSGSMRSMGVKNYFRHFFMGSPKNPLYLVLGLIEMLTDITRVISLSIRLFLNIAIVEIIVVVFAYLGHVIAPLTAAPFYLIDMFDDMLQAFIFTLLAVMYMATALNAHGQSDDVNEHLTEDAVPETIGASTG